MKKIILISISALFLVTVLVWWSTQSKLASGLYLEKQTGSVPIIIDDGYPEEPLNLPLIWVKTHPWEQLPKLEDITLIDESGKTITQIEGEYPLYIQEEYNQWHQRQVRFYINLPIDSTTKEHVTLYSNQISDSYFPSELTLTFNDEKLTFPMPNTLKINTFEKKDIQIDNWNFKGYSPILDNPSEINRAPTGYVFELKGSPGTILEKIDFWLPGMSENEYFNQHVLYSYDNNLELTSDYDEFVGESLSLPMEINSGSLMIYFPITDEMKENIIDSSYYVHPYFHFMDGEQSYSLGGMGRVGPYHNNRNREDLVIYPE